MRYGMVMALVLSFVSFVLIVGVQRSWYRLSFILVTSIRADRASTPYQRLRCREAFAAFMHFCANCLYPIQTYDVYPLGGCGRGLVIEICEDGFVLSMVHYLN